MWLLEIALIYHTMLLLISSLVNSSPTLHPSVSPTMVEPLITPSIMLSVAVAEDIISTFAGIGTSSFSGDGAAASAAELHNPNSVAVDLSGINYKINGS